MAIHQGTHIEFKQIHDDLFEARCPELRLVATGESMPVAEAALMRLIEERTEQLGVSTPSIASEHDTRVIGGDLDA